MLSDEDIAIVDIRFCDLPGLMQHCSIPAHELTEDVFEEGLGFDGSSIRGFQEIQESDMILLPDPNTAIVDPFRRHPTLNINAFVRDPVTGEPYTRDPRYVAKKAEDYLTSTGIADTCFFGPEAEFYVFDDVRFDQKQHSAYYSVDSVEGVWNSGKDEGPNLGFKPRYKEGYFPVPPMDHYQDLRSEMVLTMENMGIEIEVQHHEVGTAGQAEIDMRFDTLLSMADMLMAGLDGIQNRIEPPPPVDKDLYDLPPEELALVPQVPGSLEAALTPSSRTTSTCSQAACSRLTSSRRGSPTSVSARSTRCAS